MALTPEQRRANVANYNALSQEDKKKRIQAAFQPATTPNSGVGTTGAGGVTTVGPNKTAMGEGVSTNVASGGTASMGGFGGSSSMFNALKDFKPLNYDPYTDPQYIAAQQMAREGAKSATRSTMETMNNRGLLKSSHTNSGLAQIEQKAELAPLQLVPGLIQNAQQQHQQGFQNQLGLAAMAWDQDAYHDTAKRNTSQFSENLAINKANLTGEYMPPGAQKLIDEIIKAKTDYSEGMKAKNKGNNIDQSYFDNLAKKGVDIRSQLEQMGIDSSKFGSGVGLQDAYKNSQNAGIQTVASQAAIMNQLNNFTQTYGQTPKGAGDIVGGLSMFDTYKDMYTGLEGNPTMAREQMQHNFDAWTAEFGIQQQNANTNARQASSSAAYQNYLKTKGINADNAQKATQEALFDLQAQGGNFMEGMKFLQANTEKYKADGVDPTVLTDYLTDMFEMENYNPEKGGSPEDPSIDRELRVKATEMAMKDEKFFDLTPAEQQKLIETQVNYLKNGPKPAEPYKPFSLPSILKNY